MQKYVIHMHNMHREVQKRNQNAHIAQRNQYAKRNQNAKLCKIICKIICKTIISTRWGDI